MMRFDASYAAATRRNFVDAGPGIFPAVEANYRALLCHVYNTYVCYAASEERF
jgi:hypothetical protein